MSRQNRPKKKAFRSTKAVAPNLKQKVTAKPAIAERGTLPALQSRSRDKRDRLLVAGLSAFGELGYDEARVADIAAVAGISVGAFYQRFRDKRALFAAIEAEFVRIAIDNLQRFVDRSDPTWKCSDWLTRLFFNMIRVISQNVGFFRALVSLGYRDAPVIATARRLDDRNAQFLHRHLRSRRWIARSTPQSEVHFALATATKAIALSALVASKTHRIDQQRLALRLAKMVMRYLNMQDV